MDEDLSKEEEANKGYDYDDMGISSASSCRCFRGILCSSGRPPGGYVLYQKEEEEQEVVKEKWWEKKLKKVKVLSEVLGGPKWKNILRYRVRFRINKKIRRMQSQYDPKSYALNFDDGTEKEGDAAYVDFSARYAHPLGIYKRDNMGYHDTGLTKALELIRF